MPKLYESNFGIFLKKDRILLWVDMNNSPLNPRYVDFIVLGVYIEVRKEAS